MTPTTDLSQKLLAMYRNKLLQVSSMIEVSHSSLRYTAHEMRTTVRLSMCHGPTLKLVKDRAGKESVASTYRALPRLFVVTTKVVPGVWWDHTLNKRFPAFSFYFYYHYSKM